MRAFRRIQVAAALAAGLAALPAGCRDATEPTLSTGLPTHLTPGIYPLVSVVGETATSAQVELYLKRVPAGPPLASFQGELRYDPRVLSLEHTDLPPGLIGTTNEPVHGTIRFAAAAPDGVGDVPVLSLRFTRSGALAPRTFQVSVEEVTRAGDLADLTHQVSSGPAFFRYSAKR